MELHTSTHEHRLNAQVYTDDVQYDVAAADITWTAPLTSTRVAC